MVELSISDNLTYSFEKHIVPFSQIGSYISKYCYSASTYNNGHRHKDNIAGLGNVLIYDFDDGVIPLLSMKRFMENNKVTSAIFTTKSHQIEKNGKPAVDRYRLFVPFSTPFTLTVEAYSDFFMYIAEILNIQHAIDKACKNPSRSFYPNPSQQEIYIEAGRVFDTAFFEAQFLNYNSKHKKQVAEDNIPKAPAAATPASNKNYGYNRELKGNEVSANTDICLVSGEVRSFSDFEYLQGNETVPCRCINPAHEDRNPSAFVGRSKSSGRLMVKCSGCDATYFIKY